ncbi:MAG TPA: sigma-70 family RNA polymerase sigma factor [Candidatus Limnocylindrales bacterium]|nr:sigma-70 family RNA polymerase sigma factor [Candidatus Limnocylindrales bacterium]
MDTAELWTHCRAGDASSRALLIERYLPLAQGLARGARTMTTAVADSDDLTSSAFIGLIDAVDRFEPGRGVPFEAYARLRIRGAMIDELRRTSERARHAQADEHPRTVSLDGLLEDGAAIAMPVVSDGVDEGFEQEDLRGRVQGALETLPPRQRELLARYYSDELTLREAGVRMGISEARACQLHGRAIVNLRRALSVHIPMQHVAMSAAHAA